MLLLLHSFYHNWMENNSSFARETREQTKPEIFLLIFPAMMTKMKKY